MLFVVQLNLIEIICNAYKLVFFVESFLLSSSVVIDSRWNQVCYSTTSWNIDTCSSTKPSNRSIDIRWCASRVNQISSYAIENVFHVRIDAMFSFIRVFIVVERYLVESMLNAQHAHLNIQQDEDTRERQVPHATWNVFFLTHISS
jgi:hypothetical protein